MNSVYVTYLRVAELGMDGKEGAPTFFIRFCDDYEEMYIECGESFEELKGAFNPKNILHLIRFTGILKLKELFWESIRADQGLYFNKRWYSLSDLERIQVPLNAKEVH